MLASQKNKGFSIICKQHRAERIEEINCFCFMIFKDVASAWYTYKSIT